MTEHEPTSSRGGVLRRFWYIGDLLVIGLLLVYITYPHWRPWISYRGGLPNSGARAWGTDMLMGMLCPLAAILLLILFFRLSVSWSKHIADPKRRWILRGFVIVALALGIRLFFSPIWSSGEAFTLGLKECYAHLNVDVPAIQAWLRTVDPEDCLGDRLRIRTDALPKAEQAKWPEAIKTLKPASEVRLYLDIDRRPVIRLDWGGADEGYGIVIGSSDWEIPERQPTREEMDEQSAFCKPRYTRPLAPGAYVWYSH